MKYLLLVIMFLLSVESLACGNFGNPGDGCTEEVEGVQTVSDSAVEIYASEVTWFNNHVCTGSTTMRFSGNELLTNAALSIGMASYMSGKGPVFFRCNAKEAYDVCSCQIIVLGNTWRD